MKKNFHESEWNFINMNSPADLYCRYFADYLIELEEYDGCRDGHCLLSTELAEIETLDFKTKIISMEDGAGIGLYFGDGCWSDYINVVVFQNKIEVRIPNGVPNGDTFRQDGPRRYYVIAKRELEGKRITPFSLRMKVLHQELHVFLEAKELIHVSLSKVPFIKKYGRIFLKAMNESKKNPKVRAVFESCLLEESWDAEDLTGYCRNEKTGEALSEVSVHLCGYAGFWGMTDTDGFFRIKGVPEGSYVLAAGKEGGSFINADCTQNGTPCEIQLNMEESQELRRERSSAFVVNELPWMPLNGVWKFEFDKEDYGEKEKWFEKNSHPFSKCIKVPYSWQSLAAFSEEFMADSDLLHHANTFFCNSHETGEIGWYQRTIVIPKKLEGDACLVIGAISGIGKVWLNSQLLGCTLDSYEEYRFPTGMLKQGKEYTITIRVEYPHGNNYCCNGKQGFWFTDSPGIWQNVWIERKPSVSVSDIIADYPETFHEGLADEVTVILRAVIDFAGEEKKRAEFRQNMVREDKEAVLFVYCRQKGIYRIDLDYLSVSGRVKTNISVDGLPAQIEKELDAVPGTSYFDTTCFYLFLEEGFHEITVCKCEDTTIPGETFAVIKNAWVSRTEPDVILDFRIGENKAEECSICLNEKTGVMEASAALTIKKPVFWEAENPFEYEIEVKVYSVKCLDIAVKYTRRLGLRWFSAKQADTPSEDALLLWNGKPVFLRGVLDQGYNPWGLYTYTGTEDERPGSMLFDILAAKECGYNLIRMHIKDNEPDWYSLCDRAGMLVWDELPVNFYGKSGDPRWMGMYFRKLKAMKRKHNYHSSVMIFSAFNESWGISGGHEMSPWEEEAGQKFIKDAVREYKDNQLTVLLMDNSGYGKTEQTQLIDHHCYPIGYSTSRKFFQLLMEQNYSGSTFNFYNEKNRILYQKDDVRGLLQGNCAQDLKNLLFTGHEKQSGQPVIISEFVHSDGGDRLVRMFPQTAGYVRMNIASQENEDTSPYTAVRTKRDFGYVKEDFSAAGYEYVNQEDFIFLDSPPLSKAAAGERKKVPVYAAVWNTQRELTNLSAEWSLTVIDMFGNYQERKLFGTLPAELTKYHVNGIGSIEFEIPTECKGAYLFIKLLENGQVISRHDIQYEIETQKKEIRKEDGICFEPENLVSSKWSGYSGTYAENGRYLIWGQGAGEFVFRKEINKEETDAAEYDAELVFEMSSCECLDGTKITDEICFKNHTEVYINGIFAGTAAAEDAPSDRRALFSNSSSAKDAEGMESRMGRFGYGYRFKVPVSKAAGTKIREDGFAQITICSRENGCILFGERMGRYGCQPMILKRIKGRVHV